jgi:CRISPR-associated protein Csx3
MVLEVVVFLLQKCPLRIHLKNFIDDVDRSGGNGYDRGVVVGGSIMVTLRLSTGRQINNLAFQVIEIWIDGIATPDDLSQLRLPAGIDTRQGVVLTGRAPIWLYGWLVHECHFTRWVACYDPRLGAVVIESHTPEVRVGQVIPLDL